MKKVATRNKKYESELETKFYKKYLSSKDRPPIKPQHRFHPTRQWRFDFAFIEHKVAIEIQGYGKGHATYDSMRKDYEKHNEAVRLGWRIIYLMSHDIDQLDQTIDYVLSFIGPTKSLFSRFKGLQ